MKGGIEEMQHNNVPRNISPKSLKITKHAEYRIAERVDLSFSTKSELLQFVFNARYKGLSLQNLKLADINNNEELFNYLNKYFQGHRGSEIIRLYKGYVFVFCGSKGRILKTVVKTDERFNLEPIW